jgi:hypothetical protein
MVDDHPIVFKVNRLPGFGGEMVEQIVGKPAAVEGEVFEGVGFDEPSHTVVVEHEIILVHDLGCGWSSWGCRSGPGSA